MLGHFLLSPDSLGRAFSRRNPDLDSQATGFSDSALGTLREQLTPRRNLRDSVAEGFEFRDTSDGFQLR